MLSLCCRSQNTLFRFIYSAVNVFTLTNNKFKMVKIVDGNPQLDSRDWSMYSNILTWQPFYLRRLLKFHPFDWLIEIYLQIEGQSTHLCY